MEISDSRLVLILRPSSTFRTLYPPNAFPAPQTAALAAHRQEIVTFPPPSRSNTLFPALRSLYIEWEGLTMTDPQHYGLGELGQRMQALSDPAPEPRLRPYQGSPLPVGSPANGRPAPAAEPATNPFAEVQVTDFHATATANHSYAPYGSASVQPAAPEPFTPYAPASTAGNGFSAGGYTPLHGVNAAPETTETASATSAAASVPPAPAPLLDPNAPKTGLQKALEAVRTAIPLVQRLLPLLDGNFADTINSLMAPQGSHRPPQQPVKVDLEPVERGLAEVRTSNRELRTQVQEQGTSLKRVEDQLERVREATDRNTLEQQELVEDLRAVGNRISAFVIIGIVLLLLSLGVNIYFLIQLQHILR